MSARVPILLLERHAPSRSGLLRLLDGFDVIALGDVSSALDAARRRPIDVALIDIGFPVVDGEHVAEQIRAIHPAVRIIYLTYEPWSPTRVDGVVLVKPIAIEELVGLLGASS